MANASEEQREALQTLKADVDRLRSDLNEVLHSVKGNTKDRLTDIKTKLRETAAHLEGHAQEQLRDAYGRLREEAAEHIKKRPFGSVIAGLVAGVVLSIFLLRR